MNVMTVDGVKIVGIASALPAKSEDNLQRCIKVYGDERKAVCVVKAPGIWSCRI